MDEDFLEAARMKAPNGPRAPIPDRREVPAVAEVAAEFRLASLGLPPLIAELPIAEPLLAPELGTGRVLRGSHGEKSLQVRIKLRLRPRLVLLFLRLLFLFLLSLLLLRRLRFLFRLLLGLLLRLRRSGLFFFRGGLLRRLLLDERAETLDRKSTRLNSSHGYISYAVFCLKKKKKKSNHYDGNVLEL